MLISMSTFTLLLEHHQDHRSTSPLYCALVKYTPLYSALRKYSSPVQCSTKVHPLYSAITHLPASYLHKFVGKLP